MAQQQIHYFGVHVHCIAGTKWYTQSLIWDLVNWNISWYNHKFIIINKRKIVKNTILTHKLRKSSDDSLLYAKNTFTKDWKLANIEEVLGQDRIFHFLLEMWRKCIWPIFNTTTPWLEDLRETRDFYLKIKIKRLQKKYLFMRWKHLFSYCST